MTVDIEYKNISDPKILKEYIQKGDIVVIRKIPQIFFFREQLILSAVHFSKNPQVSTSELNEFYKSGKMLSAETMFVLIKAIKLARQSRYLSYLLSSFIGEMGFKKDILLDSGINRLSLDAETISFYKQSGLFMNEDFKRDRADGPVELFMEGYSNIHRDLNRKHSFFMSNFWIPMHDIKKEHSLLFFPQMYRNNHAVDMDNTYDNRLSLGDIVQIELKFGDMIFFHSEHLHASPIPIKGNRRHSFDFRIMTNCLDDGKHYRYNFWNLENFNQKNQTKQETLLDYQMIAMSNAGETQSIQKKDHDLEKSFEDYKKFNFAEDRYFELAKESFGNNNRLCENICGYIIQYTNSYFWGFKSFELLKSLNTEVDEIEYYKEKIVHLVNSTKYSYDLNPIEYKNSTNQITPEDVLNNL